MSNGREMLKVVEAMSIKIDKFNDDFLENTKLFLHQTSVVNHRIRVLMCDEFKGTSAPKLNWNEDSDDDDSETPTIGHIRVGRIANKFELSKGEKVMPVTNGYKNIIVTSHNKKNLGAELSPYRLADENGNLMENIWQFSKMYPKVHAQKQKDWAYSEEVHIGDGKKMKPNAEIDMDDVNDEYWAWRRKGIAHKKPIRYPNGFKHRAECVTCLWRADGNYEDLEFPQDEKWDQLNYIEARKKIYAPLYINMAKQNREFEVLRGMLLSGVNLQILDVDGPHLTKATNSKSGKVKSPYNKMKTGIYGVTSGVGSIDINRKNIKLLLDDTSQPFGHGYCLAAALLGHDEWLLK